MSVEVVRSQKTGFFDEAPGKRSMTRLLSLLTGTAAVVIAVSSVFMKEITIGDSMPMVITLLSYAAGTKIFQKFAEKK